MSDREPTKEELEAGERLLGEMIERGNAERDAKPNPLAQPVSWQRTE
jgi:hypothetical protein